MGENTKIEWATHTFNPWVGCTKVSPACDHCYAEGWAKRTGQGHLWEGQRRRTSMSNWQKVRKWNREARAAGRRDRVFCASLADVFDNQVPSEWRRELWHYIEQTPSLDWLLLTKRPQNIAKMLPDPGTGVKPWGDGWKNVWLGTTVENQAEADRRIPHLLAVPAVIRFLSCEPLLGPLDLTLDNLVCTDCPRCSDGSLIEPDTGANACRRCDSTGKSDEWGIDWVICGGESGPGARPMHPGWARALRDQCAKAGVAFHFKQWGEWVGASVYSEGNKGGFTRSQVPGETFPGRPSVWWSGDAFGGVVSINVGKKVAGRLLDGREHNDIPGAAR